jgi:hypothetical protein
LVFGFWFYFDFSTLQLLWPLYWNALKPLCPHPNALNTPEGKGLPKLK